MYNRLHQQILKIEIPALPPTCEKSTPPLSAVSAISTITNTTCDDDEEVLVTPREPLDEMAEAYFPVNIAAAHGVRPTQNDKSMVRHYPFYTMRNERVFSPFSLIGRYTRSPKTPLRRSPYKSPRESLISQTDSDVERCNFESRLAKLMISSKSLYELSRESSDSQLEVERYNSESRLARVISSSSQENVTFKLPSTEYVKSIKGEAANISSDNENSNSEAQFSIRPH